MNKTRDLQNYSSKRKRTGTPCAIILRSTLPALSSFIKEHSFYKQLIKLFEEDNYYHTFAQLRISKFHHGLQLVKLGSYFMEY